jgi:hypothetical protein
MKLIGPLHSHQARGTIAGNLTFSQRKSGAQVRWQKKQKDVITPARTAQRDEFLSARDSWFILDFGVQEFGFFLCGGQLVDVMRLPAKKRAPQFACYVRDFLS